MAILYTRQGHSFSSIHERSKSGWAFCMSKAYCKWPAIAAIVIGIIVFCLTIFCCLRCCGCLGGRGRGRRQKNQQSFIPAPYQGYQPANSNIAPPAYGQAPQYAQFDAGHRGKITADSLPHMPSWNDARETRIEDHNYNGDHRDDNVELGYIRKPGLASAAQLPPQQAGVTEADSHPVSHRAPSPYTGPDFGAGGEAPHQQHQYSGPDFSRPSHTGYSAYTPSESTRYEPSGVNEPQELGTTYSNVPMSPPGNGPPTASHAGRQPGWMDV